MQKENCLKTNLMSGIVNDSKEAIRQKITSRTFNSMGNNLKSILKSKHWKVQTMKASFQSSI
jgi:hypothetical protein